MADKLKLSESEFWTHVGEDLLESSAITSNVDMRGCCLLLLR